MQKSNLNRNPFRNAKGPTSDIPLNPEHGGPILCMAVQNDTVVTGSTDHGLRVYSLTTGKQIKQLYTKNFGHTEWVTCCTFLQDGRIVSGGMDSMLCVWDAKGVKCKVLQDHSGSISKVVSDSTNTCLSSSYDTSVRIYDMNTVENVGVLKGTHKSAVTDFEWTNSLCVTGGRDGLVALWDVNTQKCIMTQKSHNGQIGKIKLHTDDMDCNLILSAGSNDGTIVVLDMRSSAKVASARIHSGSINLLETTASNIAVTGSADKSIKLLDMTDGFKEIGSMKSTDAVFCGDMSESFLAVGTADGNLLGYDLDTLECLFGYGCDQKGSIKCLKMVPNKGAIVTGGDSGEGLELIF